jgi:hypothetical protein
MEAPRAIERDQRLAVAVKVEGLGMKRSRTGQSEHGERSQSPEMGTKAHRPDCLRGIKRNVV